MRDISQLEKTIGYTFKNEALLKKALTHSTYANENPGAGSHYERLEFVGDAVLDLLVARLLFEKFLDASEGDLSRRRSRIVRRETLAQLGKQLDLGAYVRLGEGQKKGGSGITDRLLADSYEALAGAVYLDGGYEAAVACFSADLAELIESTSESDDYKTELQETCHRYNLPVPRYEITSVEGPDHARLFNCSVWVGDIGYGQGRGSSKKIAEQQCAEQALQKLQSEVE
jgi:ribonuclease III